MAFRINTTVLVAVALIMLLPILHLSLTTARISSQVLNLFWSDASSHSTSHSTSLEILFPNEHLVSFPEEGFATCSPQYKVGDVSYFSPTHSPYISLPVTGPRESKSLSDSAFPSAALRLPLDQAVLGPDRIRDLINDMLAADDVLTEDWLQTLFLLPDQDNVCNAASMTFINRDTLLMLESEFGVKRVLVDMTFILPRASALRGIDIEVDRLFPPTAVPTNIRGPYLARQSMDKNAEVDLWPVYRLYSDTFRAFLYGLYEVPRARGVPGQSVTYQAFRHLDNQGYNMIPVPSRLYDLSVPNGVSGERIGVKGESTRLIQLTAQTCSISRESLLLPVVEYMGSCMGLSILLLALSSA